MTTTAELEDLILRYNHTVKNGTVWFSFCRIGTESYLSLICIWRYDPIAKGNMVNLYHGEGMDNAIQWLKEQLGEE